MQAPLQVTYRGIEASAALDSRIRESAAKLDQLHPRLTSCRVTVGGKDRQQSRGREFEVHIEAHAAGREAISTLKRAADPCVAVREAFDALRRRLQSPRGPPRR